jgi:hypothetical protein
VGGGLPGCSAPQNGNLKRPDFVEIMSKVLRVLPFSRNDPLKSADDQNIIIKKKNKKISMS